MKKQPTRILAFSLILIFMILSAASCGTKKTTTKESKETASAKQDSSSKNKHSNSDIVESLSLEDFSHMEPLVDALVRSCYENNTDYDASSDAYIWSALSYFFVSNRDAIPGATVTDTEILVPRKLVLSYASFLFSSCKKLPGLPDGADYVRHDSETKQYAFLLRDQSTCRTRMLSSMRWSDGEIRLATVCYDSESEKPLACYILTLLADQAENETADSAAADEEASFSYRIQGMSKSAAVNCERNYSTMPGSFTDFLDESTAECEVDGNLLTFRVTDPEIRMLLEEMKDGESVTLAVSINEKTEVRIIKSLIYQ